MHELAIANSIVDTVLAEIDRRGLNSVRSIGVRIGALTDVVPDALEFGFTAITSGTVLEKTILDIERISIKGRCKGCDSEFEVEEYLFVCPKCRGADVELLQGDELDIAYIEVDDS